MNSEIKIIFKEVVVTYLEEYTSIYMDALRKPVEISQDR
jgi:hypothetical protein